LFKQEVFCEIYQAERLLQNGRYQPANFGEGDSDGPGAGHQDRLLLENFDSGESVCAPGAIRCREPAGGGRVNINSYWQTVKRYREELQTSQPDGAWITTLPNRVYDLPAGVVSLASPELAARRLAEGSHRLATPEEIRKYHADQARAAETVNATARFFSRTNGKLTDTIYPGEHR
jgi:hypothetical protein